jgi:hypothetical protein
MKKTILLTMVLVFIGASQCFGGSAGKYVSKGLAIVGMGDTGLREAGFGDSNIRKISKPLGIIASAKDVAMVGTTAATVSGSSGSAIISTLATMGKPVAVVTGGAVSASVAGTTLAAGGAGLGAAGLLNEFVFDGDSKADQAARVGTYAGAAGATAGGVATVAAAGVTGLSAAGITSGLATVGGVVGGGMVAGTVLVVAAPVAAAVAIGGLAYWLFSD